MHFAQIMSLFAQNPTLNPCSLLHRHMPFGVRGYMRMPNALNPTQYTPFHQGWQGRWVTLAAGRQNVATSAGSLVSTKRTGSLFESKNLHIYCCFRTRTCDSKIGPCIQFCITLNSCQPLVKMCIYPSFDLFTYFAIQQ